MQRESLVASGLAFLVLTLAVAAQEARPAPESEAWERQAHAYLKSILYPREQLEDWILGKATLGEAYDSQLGWLFADRRVKHGVDGSISTYRYAGARRTIMYGDNPCRINTYGDSFTHCDQVSDGETWQEVIAAHLCEPLRNFGVGGYSVYQAYLRMVREETRTPARYIIFNIYDDRSLSKPAWLAQHSIGLYDRDVAGRARLHPALCRCESRNQSIYRVQ